MGLTKKISSQGKKMVLNPTVMRWISDDRVMKAAEGMMGARTRVRAAWKVLMDGHDLPTVDGALDDFIGEPAPATGKSRRNGRNGHASADEQTGSTNGNGHANGNGYANGSSNGHANGNGHAAAFTGGMSRADSVTLDRALKERTSLAGIGGKDVF